MFVFSNKKMDPVLLQHEEERPAMAAKISPRVFLCEGSTQALMQTRGARRDMDPIQGGVGFAQKLLFPAKR